MGRAKTGPDLNRRIAIIGASAAGLACAAALRQNGFTNVSLYDRAQAPNELEHPAPINLGANVVRAYDRLGLREKLLEHSWRWDGVRLANGNGRQLGFVDGTEILRRSGFSPITTTRKQMLSVLRSAVPEQWLHFGTEVTSVKEGPSGLTVDIKDAPSVQADIVIGADGYYSQLRDQVIGHTKKREDGKISVQALIPAVDGKSVLDFSTDHIFNEIITHRGSVGFGRNTDADFNVFFNVKEEDVRDALDGASLVRYAQDTFTGIDPRIDAICKVVQPEHIRVYFPKDRPLSKGWSKGRIVLIGDAAHPCFQYTGQGAAMAIESALVLAHCMKIKPKHKDAFRLFEKTRLPRIKVVHGESYKGAQAFGLTNPFACAVRDLVMGLLPAKMMSKPITNIHAEDFMP